MNRFLALSAAILAGSLCAPAQAGSDIRMDLSDLVGTTAGNWNNISNLTGLTSNLIDFNTGSGTGVSIDGTGSPWQDFFGDDNGSFPNQSWLTQPATQDGAGVQTDLTGSFVFSGLTGSSYQIEVVSARTTFDYLNTITVNGDLADQTYLGTPVNTPWGSTTDGLNPGNWLIWSNVVPDNGTITVVDVAGPGTLGIINAMRILETSAVVPEPSSFVTMLVGGGVVVLASCRRWRVDYARFINS